MTAAEQPTWTVAEDPVGEPTLWYGDTAVLRLCDINTGGELLGGEGAEYRHLLWLVLTRVLAPDEATVERLAQRIDSYALVLDDPGQRRWCVEDVLAALAGTAAPHERDGEVGG